MFRQITDWELQNLSNAELVMIHNKIEIERAYAARVRQEIDERLEKELLTDYAPVYEWNPAIEHARRIVAEVLGDK